MTNRLYFFYCLLLFLCSCTDNKSNYQHNQRDIEENIPTDTGTCGIVKRNKDYIYEQNNVSRKDESQIETEMQKDENDKAKIDGQKIDGTSKEKKPIEDELKQFEERKKSIEEELGGAARANTPKFGLG